MAPRNPLRTLPSDTGNRSSAPSSLKDRTATAATIAATSSMHHVGYVPPQRRMAPVELSDAQKAAIVGAMRRGASSSAMHAIAGRRDPFTESHKNDDRGGLCEGDGAYDDDFAAFDERVLAIHRPHPGGGPTTSAGVAAPQSQQEHVDHRQGPQTVPAPVAQGPPSQPTWQPKRDEALPAQARTSTGPHHIGNSVGRVFFEFSESPSRGDGRGPNAMVHQPQPQSGPTRSSNGARALHSSSILVKGGKFSRETSPVVVMMGTHPHRQPLHTNNAESQRHRPNTNPPARAPTAAVQPPQATSTTRMQHEKNCKPPNTTVATSRKSSATGATATAASVTPNHRFSDLNAAASWRSALPAAPAVPVAEGREQCVRVGGTFVPASSLPPSHRSSNRSSSAASSSGRHAATGRRGKRSRSCSSRGDEQDTEEEDARRRNSRFPQQQRQPYCALVPADGAALFSPFASSFSSSCFSMGGLAALELPAHLRVLGEEHLPQSEGRDVRRPLPSAVTAAEARGMLPSSPAACRDPFRGIHSPAAEGAGFVAKPLWSLVGTYKTALCSVVDARGGAAVRWVQRNPRGTHQRIIIPLHNIILSNSGGGDAPTPTSLPAVSAPAIAVVRVDCVTEAAAGGHGDAEESDRTSTATAATRRRRPQQQQRRRTSGRSRSRTHTDDEGESDREGSGYESGGGRSSSAAAAETDTNAAMVGDQALPYHLRGRGGLRRLTAATSTSSWAVVVRTRNMRPAQVTFGFGSALEAHRFKSQLANVAHWAQHTL